MDNVSKTAGQEVVKLFRKKTVDKFTRDPLFKTAQKIYTKEMIKFKGV